MKYKIFLITLFAVLASYLMFSTSFVFAISASDLMDETEAHAVDFSGPHATATHCGDGIDHDGDGDFCDETLDETIATCCWDCGCSTGFYCDISDADKSAGNYDNALGCALINDIGLTHKGTSPTEFKNCNHEHKANVTMRIDYVPATVDFEKISFSLDNGKYSGTTTKSWQHATFSDRYIFEITIPILEDCSAGTFVLSGNTLTLDIKFNDGSGTATKTISKGFSDITIQSWTCGDNVCNSTDLGESSVSCCYDCLCESGFYCDIAGGEDKTGECKPGLSISNLQISSLYLNRLNTDGTKDINFTLQIINPPKSVSVDNYYCSEIECAGCTATPTSITCSESGASGDVFNLSCTLSLSVEDYDVKKEYELIPKLVFEISYLNGSSPDGIYQTLSKDFYIYVQGSYCGDLVCDSELGESSVGCCYDCDCDSGYYCSVAEPEIKTLAAGRRGTKVGICKDLAALDVEFVKLDPAELTAFTDIKEVMKAGVKKKKTFLNDADTHIILNIENPPSNFDLTSSTCNSGRDDISCSISDVCEKIEGAAYQLKLKCPIQFDLSMLDLGDEKELDLKPTINLTVQFNNGPDLLTKDLATTFPLNIKIGPGCGNGECETDLGENAAICCDDCINHAKVGCKTLYGDGNWICLVHKCVDADKFNLVANIPEQKCILIREDIEYCSIRFKGLGLFITAPPGVDDLNITDSECNYKLEKVDDHKFKDKDSVGKFACELESGEGDYKNYTVGVKSGPLLEKFNKSWFDGNRTTGPLDIDCIITYNGERKTLNTSEKLTIVLEFDKKVLECQERVDEIDEAHKRLQGAADKEIKMANMFSMLAMLMMIAFVLCVSGTFGVGASWCNYLLVLAGIFSMLAKNYKAAAEKTMNLLAGEFNQLKQEFMETCQSYVSEDTYERITELNAESILAAKSKKLKSVGIISKIGMIAGLYGIYKVAF